MQPQVTAVARPGDTIAIESPTYFGLLHVLEALSLRTLEPPTDAQAPSRGFLHRRLSNAGPLSPGRSLTLGQHPKP